MPPEMVCAEAPDSGHRLFQPSPYPSHNTFDEMMAMDWSDIIRSRQMHSVSNDINLPNLLAKVVPMPLEDFDILHQIVMVDQWTCYNSLSHWRTLSPTLNVKATLFNEELSWI